MMFKHKKKKNNTLKKIGSFSFLLSIPVSYSLIIVLSLITLGLLSVYRIDREVFALFISALIGSISITSNTKMPKFRVFIHELKHAVVIILTGNKLTDFKVDKHTGHVKYLMYLNKVHFAPTITLAPYYFPLFSLPTLIACIVLEYKFKLMLSFLLGASLGFDLETSFHEIHPDQTDIKKIFGGMFLAKLYIFGVNTLWLMICFIWILAGRNGFIHGAHMIFNLIKKLTNFQ